MIRLIRKILIFSALLIPILLLGQEPSDSTLTNSRKNSVFIELLGANGYSSLNYDREIKTVKKIHLRAGFGLGYANYEGYTPQLASYVVRFDALYGNKVFQPVIGYAFSHNLDLGDYNRDFYLVHTPNVGIAIKINRVELVPKYYLMLIDRSDYDRLITVHWLGLQIKFNF